MFDILKIQKKKIVSNAVNLMPRYRSYISYNWTTTFDGSGNRQLINAGESNPDYKATLYSGRGVRFNGVDQSYKIDVVQGQALYKFDVTNNSLVTENITFTGVYELGKVGGIGAYESIIYSNVIVSNTAFTNSELDYLHNHTEKFLYHEKQTDGTFVAKSKILTQEKIDSVVAHFPMCETDGFVRNMIGYSEASPIVDIGQTYIADDDEVATHDYANGVHTVEVTTAGTNHARPFVRTTMSENFEVGATYLYSFDIKVISGTFVDYTFCLNSGNTGTKRYPGNTLSVYDVTIAEYDTDQIGIVLDGTNTFKIEISNIQAKKLTSTYQIENFTNATIDNAKNLTTGLQTCFWKRDVLGVPIGSSFDGVLFDGSGYVDTGWTPDLTKYLVTEYVVVKSYENKQFFGCIDDGTARYALGFFNGTLKILLGDKYPSFSTTDITHIVLVTTGVAGESKVFINGEDRGLIGETTLDAPKSNFYLGTQGIGNPNNSDIRLFNIHTTPRDPAKLYADAVKKGLVPEQTQST